MQYEKTIILPQSDIEQINRYLSGEDRQDDGTRITFTAIFSDNIEIDVQCCGVDDDSGSFLQAVLYNNNCECNCTEPEYEIEGEWWMEYKGDTYIVNVIAEWYLKNNKE